MDHDAERRDNAEIFAGEMLDMVVQKSFNITSLLIRGIRRRGIGGVIKFILTIKIPAVLTDAWFDIKYGTDTETRVSLNGLDIISNNKQSGIAYIPTPILALRKLFFLLKIPGDSILLDFGCGKGRVLLIASEFGFKEVRGVDFSSELCKIARNNCLKYKGRRDKNKEYKIIMSDAVDYQIRSDENVFYFYKPFHVEVFKLVLKNILLSTLTYPRKIWIIYRKGDDRYITENNKIKKVIEIDPYIIEIENNNFLKIIEFDSYGTKNFIYSNKFE